MKKTLLILALLIFIGCDDKKEDGLNLELNTTIKDGRESRQEAVLTQNLDAPFSLNFTDGTILSMKKTDNGFEMGNGDLPTVFVFITTWCPPCLAQISVINSLHDKYKDYLQINLILLDKDKNEELVNKFIEDNGINYRICADSSADRLVKSLSEVSGVPYILLYNSKGELKKAYSGLISGEMLDIDIQKVI